MHEPDVIDRAALDNLLAMVGGDESFLSEMLDTYFDDAPQQLAAMRAGLRAGNAPELRRAAHSLKSNSANFGAGRLAQLCGELEALGAAGQLGAAEPLLAQVEAAYEQAAQALRSLRP